MPNVNVSDPQITPDRPAADLRPRPGDRHKRELGAAA